MTCIRKKYESAQNTKAQLYLKHKLFLIQTGTRFIWRKFQKITRVNEFELKLEIERRDERRAEETMERGITNTVLNVSIAHAAAGCGKGE